MPIAAKAGNTLKFNNAAAHRHKGVYERDKFNFYVEERGCTEALLAHERFFGTVYDPCCGSGNIPKVLELCPTITKVFSSDIREDAWEGQTWFFDFMTESILGWSFEIDCIISNPPYLKGQIVPMIERMLLLARHKVAVLVQAPFLYSQERYELFQRQRPSRIYHLSSRPSMPPGKMLAEGIIKAVGGKEDYLWLVFEHGAPPITLTDWILLPSAKAKREQKQARAAAAAGQD